MPLFIKTLLLLSVFSLFSTISFCQPTSTEKTIKVPSEFVIPLGALYSSNLFYWYWRVVSNCRHLTDREIYGFPIAKIINSNKIKIKLKELGDAYEKDIYKNKSQLITQNKKSGTVKQDVYFIVKSKNIIDEIDKFISKIYSMSEKELDFIINYDIK